MEAFFFFFTFLRGEHACLWMLGTAKWAIVRDTTTPSIKIIQPHCQRVPFDRRSLVMDSQLARCMVIISVNVTS